MQIVLGIILGIVIGFFTYNELHKAAPVIQEKEQEIPPKEKHAIFMPSKNAKFEEKNKTKATPHPQIEKNVTEINTTQPIQTIEKPNKAPKVAFLSSAKEGKVCVNDSIKFFTRMKDFDGELVKYRLDFGDGKVTEKEGTFNDAKFKFVYIYKKVGIYTVTITAYDNKGLDSTKTLSIEVVGENYGCYKNKLQNEFEEFKKENGSN